MAAFHGSRRAERRVAQEPISQIAETRFGRRIVRGAKMNSLFDCRVIKKQKYIRRIGIRIDEDLFANI